MSRDKGLVWRSSLAAALLLGASPLAAQDNSTESAPPAAPAPVENIGPRELSNFNLSGTVTRSAEPAATTPARTPPPREMVARAPAPAASAPDRSAPARSAAVEPGEGQAQQQAAIDPISRRPTLRQPSATAAAGAGAAALPLPSPTSVPLPAEAPAGFSPLPWIAALLLLGAGAVIYFGRQRRQRYATAGLSEFVAADEPRPSPPPAARTPTATPQQPLVRRPQPQPAPAAGMPTGLVTSKLRTAPAPQGVVSTSLRPWIELELEPSRAMVTDEHAAIAFDVTLFNSGSAPARDVAIEACLLNAGQQQDTQLAQFYTSPGEVRDKIPTVAPMARITLKSAVRLPREAVQEYEVEGRKLFMPMVAINSRYRWSSGEGQSAASFLVGSAANDSAKLGPLRLDRGNRGWKALAARRYEKGIRR